MYLSTGLFKIKLNSDIFQTKNQTITAKLKIIIQIIKINI